MEPPHGRLDRDRAHRNGHAPRRAAVDRARGLLPRERSLSGRERHERQLRELLRAIPGVVVEVADVLDEHAPPRSRQRAHRQVVRERARGQEDRRLLAEQRRELLLERLDLAAARVLVGLRPALREPGQQLRVGRGRELEPVARRSSRRTGRVAGDGGSCRTATISAREGRHPDEVSPRPLGHGFSTLTMRRVSGR